MSIKSYAASTIDVFIDAVQTLIVIVNKEAERAGFDLEDVNARYAIAKVYDDWVVVLTIFDDKKDPTQFSASTKVVF